MSIRNTLYYAAGCLLLTLAACTNDYEGLETEGPVAVRFTADIAPATRASGTTWTGGDRIGVTDIGNDTQYGNVPFILKNGKFEAEEKVIYIEDAETHTFRAYYPYNAAGCILAATTDATAQQNQPAIDFLFASGATGDKDSPVVSFTDKTKDGGEDNSFHHSMSLVQFTFKAGDGISFTQVGPEGYTLDGLKHEGTFDTATGIASATAAQSSPISMQLGGSTNSQLILFPQDVGSLDLSVSHNGQNYTGTFTVPGGVFEAGKRYIYTVKVNATGLTLDGCTIGEWGNGGGESGPAEDLGYTYDNTTKTYTVYNADGLLAWNKATQSDRTINCTLTADIDMTGKWWKPIDLTVTGGYYGYQGTFDGQGHRITGLTVITDATYSEIAALFIGVGNNGAVKNLQLVDVNFNAIQEGTVGGITVSNYGTITACSVTGTLASSRNNVGGITVSNNPGTVTACWFNGTLSGANYGGIASLNYGGTVKACYWDGNTDKGVFDNQGGTAETTKVDGSTVTWQTAVDGMNPALTGNDYLWTLGTDGMPVLQKKQ